MAEVFVTENLPLELALKQFKRKVAEEGILTELKQRSYYTRPGQRRREKSDAARRRAQRTSKRQKEFEDRNPNL